jgi:hypothetical protein
VSGAGWRPPGVSNVIGAVDSVVGSVVATLAVEVGSVADGVANCSLVDSGSKGMATVEDAGADRSDESARTRATKVLSGTSGRPPDSPGKVVVGTVAGGVETALGADVTSGVAVLSAGCSAASDAGAGLPASAAREVDVGRAADGVLDASDRTARVVVLVTCWRSPVATDAVVVANGVFGATDRAASAVDRAADGTAMAVRAEAIKHADSSVADEFALALGADTGSAAGGVLGASDFAACEVVMGASWRPPAVSDVEGAVDGVVAGGVADDGDDGLSCGAPRAGSIVIEAPAAAVGAATGSAVSIGAGVGSSGLFAADDGADPRAEVSRGEVVVGRVSSSVTTAVSTEAHNDTGVLSVSGDGVVDGDDVVGDGAEVSSGVAVLDRHQQCHVVAGDGLE